MDGLILVDVSRFNKTEMTTHVVTHTKRYYRGVADEAELAQWATDAVAHVWGNGVLVTKFVPLLALREVRERVNAAPNAN